MKATLMLILGIVVLACTNKSKTTFIDLPSNYYTEQYRPQYHFTPDSMWMNDPNGMVYYEGEYHLFYQYYPKATVWGPMHWGHAISKDLVHWKHMPIGIYPDSLGWIFSGSAVVDWDNTSGLGTEENPPLIAIFTHHNDLMAKQDRNDFQYQSIAYSIDKGRTWKMYEGNPVLPNPGIRDFRDPKVMWSKKFNKWIMTLAVKDHVSFYSSTDLKSWTHESDFGADVGAHGGVWECPDLFTMVDSEGIEKWILLVSINPGGPNGGSATQYFIGEFNGKEFMNENPATDPIWLDWGKDNYAGITWSDIPEEDGRRIFIGWMSNWQYATAVPTESWRSAMTMPREIRLKNKNGTYLIVGQPVEEMASILQKNKEQSIEDLVVTNTVMALFDGEVNGDAWMTELNIDIKESKTVDLRFKNSLGEKVGLKLNIADNSIGFDRMDSGKKDFNPEFAVPIVGHYNFTGKEDVKVQIYWDACGFEVFINDGEFQMTNLVFPNLPWNSMEISSDGIVNLNSAIYTPIKKIWYK